MADRGNIHADQAVINTNQREINPEYNALSAAGQGLIGDLIITGINHHKAKKANKEIIPIRNALTNYDFPKKASAKIAAQLRQIKWLKLVRTSMTDHLKTNQIDSMLRTQNPNTVLAVNLSYKLRPSFTGLVAEADVTLYSRDKAARKGVRKLYNNQFYYVYSLPKKDHNTKADTKIWTANNGRLLKTELNNAASALARMIAQDIKNPNMNLYKGLAGKREIKFVGSMRFDQRGKVMQQNGNQYTVRVSNGTLYTINQHAIR